MSEQLDMGTLMPKLPSASSTDPLEASVRGDAGTPEGPTLGLDIPDIDPLYQEPVVQEEAEVVPIATEPTEEQASLVEENNRLAGELNRIHAFMQSQGLQFPAAANGTQAQAQQTAQAVTSKLDLTDDEYRRATESREGFVEVLQKAHDKSVENTLLRVIPVINQQVQALNYYTNVWNSFMQKPENAELVPFQEYIIAEARNVSAVSPNLELSKLVETAAGNIRKKLAAVLAQRGKAQAAPSAQAKPNPFPGRSSAPRPTAKAATNPQDNLLNALTNMVLGH